MSESQKLIEELFGKTAEKNKKSSQDNNNEIPKNQKEFGHKKRIKP